MIILILFNAVAAYLLLSWCMPGPAEKRKQTAIEMGVVTAIGMFTLHFSTAQWIGVFPTFICIGVWIFLAFHCLEKVSKLPSFAAAAALNCFDLIVALFFLLAGQSKR